MLLEMVCRITEELSGSPYAWSPPTVICPSIGKGSERVDGEVSGAGHDVLIDVQRSGVTGQVPDRALRGLRYVHRERKPIALARR